jgi:hypothetical protein
MSIRKLNTEEKYLLSRHGIAYTDMIKIDNQGQLYTKRNGQWILRSKRAYETMTKIIATEKGKYLVKQNTF